MKKWIKRLSIALVLLAAALASALMATALRSERPVGFQLVRASVAGGPPLAVGIWYPTTAQPRPTTMLGLILMSVAPDAPVAGRRLPLVVISHGNAGGPGSHADLAMALASAGYLVAAPMHHGDNYADQSGVASASFVHQRSGQLRATIDFMLSSWAGRGSIDASRIGTYGFSAGALTVLTSIGAQADLARVARHCAATPEFVCEVLKAAGSPLLGPQVAIAAGPFVRDIRIKAAVVAAPGLGFSLTPESLAAISIPVQLWHADADENVPYASNAGLVKEGLGARAEAYRVPEAGHFAFLAPCGLARPPLLCRDRERFDRAAFHDWMNARVIAFFEQAMPA